MNSSTIGILRVPGASLYYRMRGSGPLLLMIQGGAGDADTASDLSDHLARWYTVMSYDRRGQWRSRLDAASEVLHIETESADACRLLAAASLNPVYVFGSSVGAVIALDLAARYPNRVQTVIAHEPPAPHLLKDGRLRPQKQFRETGGQQGAAAALRTFAAAVGVQYGNRTAGLDAAPLSPQAEANARFFLEQEAEMLREYHLDFAALRRTAARIVLAGGEDGREHWPYRCAVLIAELLGTNVIDFPGNHAGYVTHPEPFALRLREVLTDA